MTLENISNCIGWHGKYDILPSHYDGTNYYKFGSALVGEKLYIFWTRAENGKIRVDHCESLGLGWARYEWTLNLRFMWAQIRRIKYLRKLKSASDALSNLLKSVEQI